ncbi:hypothetical protein [Pengzhenrongella sp.]|jgi:hypothetical protein|uniref:hypothetical protein n=1 Tax=Pengzhenrongella sp. TaxID=2888820 RepID=UPI002F91C462
MTTISSRWAVAGIATIAIWGLSRLALARVDALPPFDLWGVPGRQPDTSRLRFVPTLVKDPGR